MSCERKFVTEFQSINVKCDLTINGVPVGVGGGGVVVSLVAGDNITIDNSDPANPVISSSGGGGGGGGLPDSGAEAVGVYDNKFDITTGVTNFESSDVDGFNVSVNSDSTSLNMSAVGFALNDNVNGYSVRSDDNGLVMASNGDPQNRVFIDALQAAIRSGDAIVNVSDGTAFMTNGTDLMLMESGTPTCTDSVSGLPSAVTSPASLATKEYVDSVAGGGGGGGAVRVWREIVGNEFNILYQNESGAEKVVMVTVINNDIADTGGVDISVAGSYLISYVMAAEQQNVIVLTVPDMTSFTFNDSGDVAIIKWVELSTEPVGGGGVG